MTVNPSTNKIGAFDYEAILSQASLEQIAKNITVPHGAEELQKFTCYHGTPVSEIPSVFKGPRNIGGGFCDKGLYIALNEPALAIEYAQIKTQFGGNPGIMEGRLNPEKNFVVGRIQVVRHAHQADLLKGIWPADWSKNPALSNFVHSHFDILEVCGMENAGLAMSSNRIAVFYERAGSDAIHWHKMYDLKNKPIPIELFQKNVPTHLPPTRGNPITPKVSFGAIACNYGLTLLESFRFASCLAQGAAEENERLPFVPMFGLHGVRGDIRGTVQFVSDFVFHQIDPRAASIDPRMAVEAKPLDPQTKKALKEQAQMDARNCAPTTLYMDEMLEHGVVPRDMPQQSPSVLALQMERARKWRTRENQIVDTINEKLDLNEDPYVALEYSNLYSKMLGDIQLPPDFFTWTSKQQGDWLQGLAIRAESCLTEAIRQTRANHSMVAIPQGQTVSEDAPNFTPDLSLLEVTAPDLMLHTIDPETLGRLSLNLPWRVTVDPVSGAEILQTAVEMAPGDMELISQDVELAPAPIRIQPRPPRPGFNELATFTHFELGEGIGGGLGFIGTQRSGAQVSISTTGDALITGVRVPMTQGFLNGLGTGLVYTAPIAAIFLAINHVLTRHDSEVAEHLKKDNKAAEKEGQRVNSSLQNFDQFADLFSRGLIDEAAFLRDVNQITGQIHDAAHNMGSRGRYAERHDADGMDYFFSSNSLRQIELDLKKIAAEALVKRKVEEQYIPQLQGKPLPALASELNALLNKRVLTLSEKFMQDALIGEISVRSQSGDLDALGVLDQLAGRPVALALNPASVAKPSHISKSHYWDDPHSQERKADRVKGWANKLDDAYTRFEKAAAEGNIPEMERAANDVAYQIQRAKGEGEGTHIHLKDYDLKNVKDPANPKEYIKTAWKYYENYITTISSNVDTTLARARVAQSGVITNESPAIFTADEIRLMKVKTASDAFDAASNKLHDPSNGAGQEQAFLALHQAALVLNSLGITDPNVLKVIAIATEHGTYGQFQVELARLNGISAKLDSLQQKLDGMQIEGEDYGTLYLEAFEITDELLKQGLSEADLSKVYQDPNEAPKVLAYLKSVHNGYLAYGLTELQKQSKALEDPKLKQDDRLELLKKRKEKAEELIAKGLTEEKLLQILPEDCNASDIYQWVKSMPEDYPHLLRIDHYENVTHHCYSAPAVRFVMHVLNDQQRMRGPSFALRPAVLALGTVNTLAPDLLPRGVNWLIALRMKENGFVTNALFQKCGDAVRSNALTRLKGDLHDPRAFLAISFDHKVTAIQGANAVVQLVARGVTACVSERVGTPISRGALVLNATANALYYVNTINRTVKYLEVSEGVISLGMSGFDVYEFLATHPSEYGASQSLIGTVKFYLPNFEGNLPETEIYYSAKDVIATVASVAAGVFIKSPVLRGLAFWKSAGFFYNRYFSTVYTDDMLTAIMTNYRYFSVMKLDDRKNASMGKLIAFIGDKLKLETGDSQVVQKAKQYVFEHQIDLLELEKNWQKLVEETVIDLSSCTFVKRNIALVDVINVALKRHTALLNLGSQLLLQSFDEFEMVSTHLDAYLSKLEEKHRSYVESVRSNLQNIKRCFLTNFCKYYVQNKIEVTTEVALMMFDKIPKEERDCIHWYFLGTVAAALWESTGLKKHSLVGLQLLSFEAALEILQKKRRMGTLERFEEALILLCEKALKYLPGQLKSQLPFNKETELFTPVVEAIIAE